MTDFSSFDHLFDPIIILDKEMKVHYFNHQSTVYFKMPPRLLKNSTSIIQICQCVDFDLYGWLKKALNASEVQISPELRLNLSQDTDTEYSAVIKVIPLENNLFSLVVHDSTVEKNLHLKYRDQLEELKKTHIQILQADKLTTLGELTASISHEINNPLTIATGHSEIIQDYLKKKNPLDYLPKIQSANTNVLESLERVNQIIKNMKDFLRQNEEQKEYCDLDSIVDSALEWTATQAKKASVTFQKKTLQRRTVVLGNRIRLEQVLINLVKNSIDAIKSNNQKDGVIEISLGKSEAEHQFLIDIKDNGPGIPESMKPNLFTPFMTTKESGHGTGLGLSICSKIIEGHLGQLENIPAEIGCHFQIRLPLIEIMSYARNEPSLSGSKHQKKILVLDNEVQILNVLNAFIHDGGYVFVGSCDPRDALDFLGKARIDLIVTDFSMPFMNGGEFVSEARKLGYEGPILYMTSAKNIDQYNKDQKTLGIGGLIVKPFKKDEVMNTIHHALKAKGGQGE